MSRPLRLLRWLGDLLAAFGPERRFLGLFASANTPSPFRELDKWLRRHCGGPMQGVERVRTKLRMLRAARIPEHDARR